MRPIGERALRWAADAVHPGAEALEVERLLGGVSTPIYRLKIRADGYERHVVLRLFEDAAWLKREPDLVRREAASLRRAALNDGVPTPRIVAVDESGDACGIPAMLMTRLEGRVVLEPSDMGEWLDGLSRAIVSVHRVEANDFPWPFEPYCEASMMDASSWSRSPEKWKLASAIASGARPAFVPRFIHRDYHPANVLWKDDDGNADGIVDWVNGCVGPAGVDVGHCRVNLAQLHGVGAADEFLDRYREHAGVTFAYDPYWDLLTLIDYAYGEPPEVYGGWTALGVTGLTNELVAERLDDYLESLLERVSRTRGMLFHQRVERFGE
ncbi:phosphotransferase family protein [Cohnella suwonensis]|uniref:Phosphotransferase family protein n=1 Tax=Cohnella suwonensis TaxID=696072 RepID=A0ABW0LP19_9BACL